MTVSEIKAALKQLLSKADFTAAVNDLCVWVQGKFTTLKTTVDENVVSVSKATQATSGSVETYEAKNAKGESLGKVEIPSDLSKYDNSTSDFQSGEQVAAAVAAAVGAVYRPSGNITAAELVEGLLKKDNLGKVYNLTDDATTTTNWVDGAGHTVKAGTEVSIVEDTTGVYKFNAITLAIDLSNYLQPSDFETIGETEAKAIVAAAIAAAEAED